MRRAALALLAFALGCATPSVPDATLTFRREGRVVRALSFAALADVSPVEVVSSDDAYYGRHVRFHAMRLEPILERAFGEPVEALRRRSFVLRASDGYAVPVQGSRLLEGGAYVAVDEVGVGGFRAIGPQRVSPAPAYLVWTRPGQTDLETHPRPWQLVAIEIVRFETSYPHVVPSGEPEGGPAMRGFALFRDHCIRCHAINREGGRVGPDLNVPQSIVDYRPEAQIRAYVRDPRAFRYGAMPPHPELDDDDLSDLIAYLRAMSTRKHDPEGASSP